MVYQFMNTTVTYRLIVISLIRQITYLHKNERHFRENAYIFSIRKIRFLSLSIRPPWWKHIYITLKSQKQSQQGSSLQYYNDPWPPPILSPALIFSSGGGFLSKVIKHGSLHSQWSQDDHPLLFQFWEGRKMFFLRNLCFSRPNSSQSELKQCFIFLVNPNNLSQTFTVKLNWLHTTPNSLNTCLNVIIHWLEKWKHKTIAHYEIMTMRQLQVLQTMVIFIIE